MNSPEAQKDTTKGRTAMDERLRAELNKLAGEDDRTQAIINAIGDPLSIQDTSFRVLYQNEMHKHLVGDHLGELCYRAYANKDSVCEACPLAVTFSDGRIHTVEKDGTTKKGIVRIEITASPLKDPEGNIVAGIEVVRDLTLRRKSEDDLRRAEKQFRSLVEQSLVGVFIYQDGFFSYVNPKAAMIFGYTQEDLCSRPVSGIIAEGDFGRLSESIRALMDEEMHELHTFVRGRRKDGAVIEIEAQGRKTEFNGRPAIVGSFLDITERRKMEADVLRSQKLESLGAFAGNIALEYNNILTALIGNLALAKMYAKPGYEVFDILNEAEKASLRAKDLTQQLLSFAKGGTLIKKVIFLQELIRDMVNVAFDSKAVACDMAFPDNLWPVAADESQLRQAMKALLLNAHQATPAGGIITISGENIHVGPASSVPLRQGRYVMLAVADSGDDMSAKELQTLFDPFRSGENKRGALGLASSFAIVKKHDGHITAESHPGRGTTVCVYLPAGEEHSPAVSIAGEPSLRGKILIMDDEEIVRVVANRLLLQCGFETELARNGEDMLRLYRTAKDAGSPFVAVIMDLIIQDGMGGREAIQHLLTYDPHAKVIVSSGYSYDPIMASFRKYGFSGFLPKPYKLEELKRVLAEVISHKP